MRCLLDGFFRQYCDSNHSNPMAQFDVDQHLGVRHILVVPNTHVGDWIVRVVPVLLSRTLPQVFSAQSASFEILRFNFSPFRKKPFAAAHSV